LGFGGVFFGMDKLYWPSVFGITTAITFIMVAYSTRKVISYTCIEGFIAAFDNVDMPGHGKETLPDCVVLMRKALRPYRRLFASLSKALRPLCGLRANFFIRDEKIGVSGGTNRVTRLLIVRWASLPQTPIPLPQDNTLGSRLKHLRQSQGITQNTLATLCSRPVSLIAKYEQNKIKKPSPYLLQELARALKTDTNKLIHIQDFQAISNKQDIKDIFDHLVPPKDFGSKLKNLRLKHKINQKELALKLGLNRESIRRYEKNITTPNQEIQAKIAKILKIDVSTLTNNNQKEAL
jgi:transcriptional regulator with XRE-family HTH domain